MLTAGSDARFITRRAIGVGQHQIHQNQIDIGIAGRDRTQTSP